MRLTPREEWERVDAFAAGLPRSPRQLNRTHETDAELVADGIGRDEFVAVKTDAIAEELATGLYADPWLAGWMVVTANLSDLAAVGAEPIGVLVAAVFPRDADAAFRAAVSTGIGDACRAAGTYVLGGDTNEGRALGLCGTALGRVPRRFARTRLGASPGDVLYLTGPAGAGAAFALSRIAPDATGGPVPFRPVARLGAARIVREHARCCIDTSDGVVAALDVLMRLNGCGFVLDLAPGHLHPSAAAACARLGTAAWVALAAIHGEYELCFTVDPSDEEALLRRAAASGVELIRAGRVVSRPELRVRTRGEEVPLPMRAVRELSAVAARDPFRYACALAELGRAGPGRGP